MLFICTANYYRSRFCEHLFNHLAAQHHLNCVAISRAVALELGVNNVGPISTLTIQGLEVRGVPLPENFRRPLPVTAADLESASPVIALDADEHRPLMAQKFPRWADRITYWAVGDLHITTSAQALAVAEQEVRALIQRLVSTAAAVIQEGTAAVTAGRSAGAVIPLGGMGNHIITTILTAQPTTTFQAPSAIAPRRR